MGTCEFMHKSVSAYLHAFVCVWTCAGLVQAKEALGNKCVHGILGWGERLEDVSDQESEPCQSVGSWLGMGCPQLWVMVRHGVPTTIWLGMGCPQLYG